MKTVVFCSDETSGRSDRTRLLRSLHRKRKVRRGLSDESREKWVRDPLYERVPSVSRVPQRTPPYLVLPLARTRVEGL